ncbi:MAG: hypothetical protein AMJ43_04710 [Coxiella sp. DG_40]|nr:MAG: hypothetical protein AMJ43_04710 [Coxiella sp. DG_40]
MIRHYLIATCYSTAIHFFTILLLFNYFKSNSIQRIGYQHLIQAYVVNQPHIISKHEFQKHQLPVLPKSSKQGTPVKTILNKLKIKSGTAFERNVPNTPINHSKLSGKNEHLLILLHNQIQYHINENVYNLPKILDSQSVLIQFLLTPRGSLNFINIIKSSGIKILDNLAIKAVTSIAPFHPAKKYLVHNTYFRIKFHFE